MRRQVAARAAVIAAKLSAVGLRSALGSAAAGGWGSGAVQGPRTDRHTRYPSRVDATVHVINNKNAYTCTWPWHVRTAGAHIAMGAHGPRRREGPPVTAPGRADVPTFQQGSLCHHVLSVKEGQRLSLL